MYTDSDGQFLFLGPNVEWAGHLLAKIKVCSFSASGCDTELPPIASDITLRRRNTTFRDFNVRFTNIYRNPLLLGAFGGKLWTVMSFRIKCSIKSPSCFCLHYNTRLDVFSVFLSKNGFQLQQFNFVQPEPVCYCTLRILCLIRTLWAT